MKLVDILARELKVWPDSFYYISWDIARNCAVAIGRNQFKCINNQGRCTPCDYRYAEVRREQWQAAVDALRAAESSPAEWNGEGLPPVDFECEVMGGGLPSTAFDWERCTILLINEGADGKRQVCTRDFRGDLAIYYPEVDSVYFRPIRTAEQIAAEERKRGIDEMHRISGEPSYGSSIRACLGELYDAGYRKP